MHINLLEKLAQIDSQYMLAALIITMWMEPLEEIWAVLCSM